MVSAATSSTVPARPTGMERTTLSMICGGRERAIGVSMKPGAMQFTVIPYCARARARERENPTRPPFALLYPADPKFPSHAREDSEMICAENNQHLFEYHIPVADKPDF